MFIPDRIARRELGGVSDAGWRLRLALLAAISDEEVVRILVDQSGYELLNIGDIAMLQACAIRMRDLWPTAEIAVVVRDQNVFRPPWSAPCQSRGELVMNSSACCRVGFLRSGKASHLTLPTAVDALRQCSIGPIPWKMLCDGRM